MPQELAGSFRAIRCAPTVRRASVEEVAGWYGSTIKGRVVDDRVRGQGNFRNIDVLSLQRTKVVMMMEVVSLRCNLGQEMRCWWLDEQDDVSCGASHCEAAEERAPLRVHHGAHHGGLVMPGHHDAEQHYDQARERVEGSFVRLGLLPQIIRRFGGGCGSASFESGSRGTMTRRRGSHPHLIFRALLQHDRGVH